MVYAQFDHIFVNGELTLDYMRPQRESSQSVSLTVAHNPCRGGIVSQSDGGTQPLPRGIRALARAHHPMKG